MLDIHLLVALEAEQGGEHTTGKNMNPREILARLRQAAALYECVLGKLPSPGEKNAGTTRFKYGEQEFVEVDEGIADKIGELGNVRKLLGKPEHFIKDIKDKCSLKDAHDYLEWMNKMTIKHLTALKEWVTLAKTRLNNLPGVNTVENREKFASVWQKMERRTDAVTKVQMKTDQLLAENPTPYQTHLKSVSALLAEIDSCTAPGRDLF